MKIGYLSAFVSRPIFELELFSELGIPANLAAETFLLHATDDAIAISVAETPFFGASPNGGACDELETSETTMSKPIAVRRATSADKIRLLEIQSAALRKLAADHYDTAIIDVIVGNAGPMLDEMIAREHCFAAECGGVIVGWGGWTARASARVWLTSNLRFPPPHAEVWALYVDPAWIGRGFARRILTAIEGDMSASGHRQADLIATLNSISFFKRLGYSGDRVGEAKLAHDVPFRWLDMSKALGPSPSAVQNAA